jgi:dethiobiotin synthetase
MSPLGEDSYVADLAEEFSFPLVVVSTNVLGTINQTLQTLIAAATWGRGGQRVPCPRLRGHVTGYPLPGTHAHASVGMAPGSNMGMAPGAGLPVAGVVLNHPAPPPTDDASLATNRAELAARCVPPILAEVFWNAEGFDAPVDWFALAR